MNTRLTALAAAVSSLSLLSACGGGGGSGDIPEYTPTPVVKQSTAEGFWEGAIDSGGSARTTSSVVTFESNLWMAYSVAGGSTPAGFYTATGTDNKQNTFSSATLKEFNFEGNGAKQGSLVASYVSTTGYSSANTLAFDLQAFNSASSFAVSMNASVYFAAANGPLNMIGFEGTYDSSLNTGSWTGTTTIPSFATTMHYTQSFSMDEATGSGTLNQFSIPSCTDNTGSGCAGLSGPLSGDYYHTIGSTDTDAQTPLPFVPVDGWTGQWTLQVYKAVVVGGHPTFQYLPMRMNVTLHSLPASTSITAHNFVTHYNPVYEQGSNLLTIAGSYTSGFTGIDTTMHSNASLTITSSGLISGGVEPTSHCAYSGSISTHLAGGNVYDVKNITFSDNGGSCVYSGSGTFSGALTYNAGKLVLTALNANSDKGFMVVTNKP